MVHNLFRDCFGCRRSSRSTNSETQTVSVGPRRGADNVYQSNRISRSSKEIIEYDLSQRQVAESTLHNQTQETADNYDNRSVDGADQISSRPLSALTPGDPTYNDIASQDFVISSSGNDQTTAVDVQESNELAFASPSISTLNISRFPSPISFTGHSSNSVPHRLSIRDSRPSSIGSTISSRRIQPHKEPPAVGESDRFTDHRRKLRKDLCDKIRTSTSPAVQDALKIYDENAYILDTDLKEVLKQHQLEEFVDLTPIGRIDPNHLRQFRKIIAILILTGWTSWDKFRPFFYGSRPRRGRFLRSDEKLPFQFPALKFLEEDYSMKAFYDVQRLFNPAVLTEYYRDQSLQSIQATTRLPLSSKVACNYRQGANRQIYKIEAEDGMVRNNDSPIDPPFTGTNKKVYAVKEFQSVIDFDREYHIQKELLTLSFAEGKHPHIVYGICFFRKEYEMNLILYFYHAILYPWADLDLEQLLLGNFPGYSTEKKGAFTGKAILRQLVGLLEALKHLHVTFDTLHSDIKPANILIYNMSASPCGIWKLADFGLAAKRGGTNLMVVSGESSDDRTSIPAPRDTGPYQPPEMRSGSNVNRMSDVYSIGALFYVVLAFITGGPDLVLKFRSVRKNARSNLSDDKELFFYQCSDNSFKLKAELDVWDDDLIRQYPRDDDRLRVRSLLDLIRVMINPVRDMRPTAEIVLQDFCNLAQEWPGDLDQMWSYERQPDNIIVQRQSPSLLTLKHQESPVYIDWHRTQIGQAKPVKPKFTGEVSKITTGQKWYVIWSRTQARPYNISVRARGGTHTIISYRPPDDFAFTSVDISGDFMASIRVRTSSAGVERVVELADLTQTRPLLTRTLPDDCRSIVVSAKGVLAFVLVSKVELYHSVQGQLTPCAVLPHSTEHSIKAVAFSHDGDYLCICTTHCTAGDEKVVWLSYRYEEQVAKATSRATTVEVFTGMRRRYWHVPQGVAVTGSRFNIVLSPCFRGQTFFAFGQNNNYWVIDCEDTRLKERVEARLHNCGILESVSPLSPNSVLLISRPTNIYSVSLSAVSKFPPSGGSQQPQSFVYPFFGKCDYRDESSVMFTSTTILDGFTYLLIVYEDGHTDLRQILLDQQDHDDDGASIATIRASQNARSSEDRSSISAVESS